MCPYGLSFGGAVSQFYVCGPKFLVKFLSYTRKIAYHFSIRFVDLKCALASWFITGMFEQNSIENK